MQANGLWRSEDWWAVCLGFFLIILVVVGFITDIPRLAKLTTNPFDALPFTTLLKCIGLWLGLPF